MASWVTFLRDVDYRHKSRAVTAYRKGMVQYLPDHIVNDPQLDGKIEKAEKPQRPLSGDVRRVYLEDGNDAG